jgi:diguanylate cyclase (GGDEF)-like protein/PAS domain S-box-containing protein
MGIHRQGRESGGLRCPARFPDENPNPVMRVMEDGTLLRANRGSWLLLSHWKAAEAGPIPADWSAVVRQSIESRASCERELQIGSTTYQLVFVPVADQGYVDIFGLDVTGRKRVERRLRLDAQVFENAAEGIMIVDPAMLILDVNHSFQRITGYSREEVLGRSPAILKSGRHDDDFYSGMWETIKKVGRWQGEIWDRRKNGEVYPKHLSISAVRDERGEITDYVGIFSDISTIKRTEEQLEYLSHNDSLTGLANRRHFLDRLELGIEEARRSKDRVAVLFIDLDGFKQVNDTYGHRAGDQYLREAADRIKSMIRQTDTVARIGGDEFALILPRIGEVQNSTVAARKLQVRMAEPIFIDSREVYVSSSIGIAIFPEDAADAESLVQRAGAAMKKAKELGKNCYRFYSPEMNARVEEVLSMKTKIRRGLDLHEFLVHYQPQIEAGSGRVAGVEALVRWNSTELGMVYPDRFIGLAEETGMIDEIGEIVLMLACRQGQSWREEGLPDLRIAVNLSAVQLRRSDFSGILETALLRYGMPPGGLEIELTESVMLVDDEVVMKQLHRLKAAGVDLAIDDFGTKYSSLAYLRKLPIDRLKIDRSFVKDLPSKGGNLAIASAIIAMGHNLGLEVIAEGVETADQARLLAGKGCDYLQGNLFSMPIPPEEMRELIDGGIGFIDGGDSESAESP